MNIQFSFLKAFLFFDRVRQRVWPGTSEASD